jgi:hypothetical protein
VEFDRDLSRAAAFVGIRPWELRRMEPREVYALVDGDARRFSRLAELFAWGVWVLAMSMPFTQPQSSFRYFRNWLKAHTPPGFIKPEKAKR